MSKKHDIENKQQKKSTTINNIPESKGIINNLESSENNTDYAQLTNNNEKEDINEKYNQNLQKYEKPGILGKFILKYEIIFIGISYFLIVFLGFLIAVIILSIKYKIEKKNQCEGCYKKENCPNCTIINNKNEGIEGSITIKLINNIIDNNEVEIISPYYLFNNPTINIVNISDSNGKFIDLEKEGLDGHIKYYNELNGKELTIYFKNLTQSGCQMFYNNQNIKEINFTNFNLSFLTNTKQMFYNMTNLENIIGLEKINMSNIFSMEQMFYNCEKLNFSNLFKMDVKNVTSTKEMFYNCRNLTSINLSNQYESKLMDMESMFAFSNIQSVDMGNFKASKLIGMSSMFSNCLELNYLNISQSLEYKMFRKFDCIFNNTNITNLTLPYWLNLTYYENKDCSSNITS